MSGIPSGRYNKNSQQRRAVYDIDTGLLTKVYADEIIDEYISSTVGISDSTVLIIDLDNFTDINDAYGVKFADTVLAEVADVMRICFGDCVMGRCGGDEYVVLIKNKCAEDVYECAQELGRRISGIYTGENEKIKLSASIAIADTKDAANYYDLFDLNDRVISYIKFLGGHKVKTYRMANGEIDDRVEYLYGKRIEVDRGYIEKRNVSPTDIVPYSMILMEDTRDIPSSINILLGRIGVHYGVERVSVTSVKWDTLDFRFSYQWSGSTDRNISDYVQKITIRNYYDLAMGYDKDGLRESSDENGDVLGSSIEAAMYTKGRYSGALRIEKEEPGYKWSDNVKKELLLLSNILGTYISREEGEQQLRLKEFEMDVMSTAIKGGVKVVLDDSDRTILNISESLCELFGYTQEELLGKTDGAEVNLIYPEDMASVKEQVNTERIHDTDSYTLKYRVQCKDGSLKYILDYGRRVVDDEGRSVFYSTCTDVTEIEQSAQQIRELYNQSKASEEFIRIALRNTKTAEFHYYPNEHRCVLPERSCELLGSRAEYTEMPYDLAEEIVAPEMQKEFIDTFNSISPDNMTASCSFKLRSSESYIKVTLSAMLDEGSSGNLSVVVGIAEDISDETTMAQERMRIIESISDSYFAMYHIKPNEGTYTAMSQSEEMTKVFPVSGGYDEFRKRFGEIFIAPDYREKYDEYTSAEFAKSVLNENHRFENFEYKHNYGEHKGWVRASLILVSMKDGSADSYMLAFADINDEKEREERQREEHRMLSAAISDSYEKIYELDLDKNSIYEVSIVNGYSEKKEVNFSYEAMTKLFRDKYIHPDDIEEFETNTNIEYLKENLSESRPALYLESRMKHYDDMPAPAGTVKEYYWKSFTYKLLHDLNGRCVMLFLSDIDERKTRELEIRQSLQDAYDMTIEANNAKSDFLSKMSHDIRTPMNGITGMTSIAKSHLDDIDKVKDCLDKIEISSRYLLSLINDILDMSKIESKKMTLNEGEVNLSDLIEGFGTILRPMIEKKHHKFVVTTKDVVHEDILSDGLRIQQVLVNLLSNAVKYTQDNGLIELKITELPSEIKGLAHFEFIVKDNGMGMTEEYQKTIFDPFSRAEDSRTSKIQGTGLGMAITKQIVNMMNGEISVKSKLNEGSEFKVDIYFKLLDKNYEEREKLEGKKVLIIDDDETALEGTSATLETMGMIPYAVRSCDEALAFIAEMGSRADELFAVLADMQMPEKNGIETTRELKQVLKPGIPVIIATGYEVSELEEECKTAGVECCITKPLFRSRLVPLFMEYISGEEEDESLADVIERTDFTGYRILLVEDNEINMEIASEILSYTCAEIDTAENGQIALEKVRDNPPGYYDVVLMDVQMPVMNGYEATRAIRGLDRSDTKVLPIIACTANAFADDINDAKQAGMNGHIAKPIDFEELMRVMNKWLN
ncbi:MAG: response regulator [bacterium]|nr:response regulator [bacterium]